jgi:MarR family transcriptional regulator for hemolysin
MKYDIEESTSTLIKKASHLYIRLANKFLKKYGVPHAYTPFLLQLWIEDGQTQSVLHKKIGIEQPTAVRTLDRMERDQFIKRERSENDRRAIKISLTKKSIILKDKMFDIATEMNDLALDGLTAAERKMFNKFLRITIDNIENQLAN